MYIYHGTSLYKYGEYSESELTAIHCMIKKDSYVIDLGANIGGLTIPMAHAVGNNGRVYAYEPQRIIYQNLVANVALNRA